MALQVNTHNLDAEYSTAIFQRVAALDQEEYLRDDYLNRWLFAERLYARGERKEMSFFDYEGPAHISKYLRWIQNFNYADWFGANDSELARISAERDRACLERFSLDSTKIKLAAIGAYNAQDYMLQRFYPAPERMQPRTILDFGAGHGRMANLALRSGEGTTERMIAIDAIPGSYLTQRAYYVGLGIDFADYLDHRADGVGFDLQTMWPSKQLFHLPTWRFDLVPDSSVDLVCCVQVLKELPRRLVPFVLEQFARVVRPGGAVYVRDHVQLHHPNQMPIDQLLLANGFTLEFAPAVKDRSEIHGLPRLWRKLDTEVWFDDTEGDARGRRPRTS